MQKDETAATRRMRGLSRTQLRKELRGCLGCYFGFWIIFIFPVLAIGTLTFGFAEAIRLPPLAVFSLLPLLALPLWIWFEKRR